MKPKVLFILAALGLPFLAGCDETTVIPEPENPEGPVEPTPGEPAPEEPVEVIDFSKGVTEVSITADEAEALGLYTISQNDDRFMRPILSKRRTVVDMRAGTEGTIVIDLLEAANLRWGQYCEPKYPCAIKGDIAYTSTVWIFNPYIIDYGPVIARSLSPTRIQITRKADISADQKPVEIELERSLLGWVPFEPGVRATIVVELTDTPADSKDTDRLHYITAEQADALGLYHIPFDSEEFRAPIFEGGTMEVTLGENNSPVTVELPSPAQIQDNMSIQQWRTPINGVEYWDLNADEWIFTPSQGQNSHLTFTMPDPFHITVGLSDSPADSDFDHMGVGLYRGNFRQASDAGEVYGTLIVHLREPITE